MLTYKSKKKKIMPAHNATFKSEARDVFYLAHHSNLL